jgi:HEAT repeats
VGVRLDNNQKRGRSALVITCLALSFFSGCAETMENMTSEHFKQAPFTNMYHALFYKDPDPLDQLRKSQEGDVRAKAMLELQEPKRSGRPASDQDEVIQILQSSATTENRAICRLGAVEALGRFEDPRATQILMQAYSAANQSEAALSSNVAQTGLRMRTSLSGISSFTPDMIITIQSRTLESLGKQHRPEALPLLFEVATMPAKKLPNSLPESLLAEGSLGQDPFDLRLAALRALENFKGDQAAAQFLYKVVTTETDVAIKDRAYMSLKTVTGKDWAPTAPEWATHLHVSPPVPKMAPVPLQVSPVPVQAAVPATNGQTGTVQAAVQAPVQQPPPPIVPPTQAAAMQLVPQTPAVQATPIQAAPRPIQTVPGQATSGPLWAPAPPASPYGQQPANQQSAPAASPYGQQPAGQQSAPAASPYGQQPASQQPPPAASPYGQQPAIYNQRAQ